MHLSTHWGIGRINYESVSVVVFLVVSTVYLLYRLGDTPDAPRVNPVSVQY